ncbi:hypothetical protein [Paenirhodobacter populi]|uniref:Uncharacterized protein n=1 Tax=Paenirhodobacter populi TaxID=2306993 RepID=A0A443JVS9_9RHOB|nr:hypothetical protein [Sinirhodobacter populi]RWR24632.1 hypothetical protein D2T30_01650 [Sinirhodobacter populi]
MAPIQCDQFAPAEVFHDLFQPGSSIVIRGGDRRGDLMEQIAMGYPSRERFLTLAPPTLPAGRPGWP